MNNPYEFPYFDLYNGGSDAVADVHSEFVSELIEILYDSTEDYQDLHHAEIIVLFEAVSPFFPFVLDQLEEDSQKYNILTDRLEYALIEIFKNLDDWGEQDDMNKEVEQAFAIYNAWLNQTVEATGSSNSIEWRLYFNLSKTTTDEIYKSGVLESLQKLSFSELPAHETLSAYAHVLDILERNQISITERQYAGFTEDILALVDTLQAGIELDDIDADTASMEYALVRKISYFKKGWSAYGKHLFRDSEKDQPKPVVNYTALPKKQNTSFDVCIADEFKVNKDGLITFLFECGCRLVGQEKADYILTRNPKNDPDLDVNKYVQLNQLLTKLST